MSDLEPEDLNELEKDDHFDLSPWRRSQFPNFKHLEVSKSLNMGEPDLLDRATPGNIVNY